MGIFRAYDIRGIYGKDLTEEIMTRIGEAAGTCCPGTFTIGRDFREHGAQLEKAFVSGLKKTGWNCDDCSRQYSVRCVVCGEKRCEEHADVFDVEREYSKPNGVKATLYNSLRCKNCKGWVCKNCCEEKRSFFSGRTYICKKCGSELQFWLAASKFGKEMNRINNRYM
jgi:hypothetical protein